VFRELEIGSGKPAPAERDALPHHLFDALALGERATAGWYGRAARATLAAIRGRGRAAVLVGGSGLYLEAARRGLADEPPHDPMIRARLRAELTASGPEALHARLAVVDPEGAARLHPRDRQRVTRALEVWESSGKTLAWWHAQAGEVVDPAPWTIVELTSPPDDLRTRIAARTRWMFASGLVEETRALVARGLKDPLRALRAVGYDEALALLEGRLDRAAAEARTTLRTAQLAKRQRTWFRHRVEALRIEAGEDAEAIARDVLEHITRG
jgi:tRNA dimethylallyltransferase